MKLFQRNKYVWPYGRTRIFNRHYQFLIIKGKSLLHLHYEDKRPCPFTGFRVIASLLAPDHLFGMDIEFKRCSWSFYLFSNYWED